VSSALPFIALFGSLVVAQSGRWLIARTRAVTRDGWFSWLRQGDSWAVAWLIPLAAAGYMLGVLASLILTG
jgi:predicted ABC-type sugar transport system permease subunit